MSISITTIEHGIASALHEVVVGAKAAEKVLAKVLTVAQQDGPAIEALAGLVDPRAAAVVRVSEALLGQVIPQVQKIADDAANAAGTPSVTLTTELVADIKALATAFKSEINTAKQAAAPVAP